MYIRVGCAYLFLFKTLIEVQYQLPNKVLMHFIVILFQQNFACAEFYKKATNKINLLVLFLLQIFGFILYCSFIIYVYSHFCRYMYFFSILLPFVENLIFITKFTISFWLLITSILCQFYSMVEEESCWAQIMHYTCRTTLLLRSAYSLAKQTIMYSFPLQRLLVYKFKQIE